MKNFLAMAGWIACLLPSIAQSQVVTITHPGVNAQASSPDQVANVFLGKSDALPGAAALRPIDQPEGSEAREQFYKSMANRDQAQVKAYWARMIFTGKGKPPPSAQSDADVKKFVSTNPGAIGYISKGAVDNSVKVLPTP